MVDGFSGGISHKSRFVDRSNIPRKIGRPQFNGADKRVQTSGGLKNIRKEVKKNQALHSGKSWFKLCHCHFFASLAILNATFVQIERKMKEEGWYLVEAKK